MKLPCMPGGKHSPPLPPKKVMICVPQGGLDSSPSPSPNPLSGLSQKCAPSQGMSLHHGTLLPSQLAGLSSLHQSHGHPLQLQYGSLHAPSRIIEELNKTLALSMQRFERSVSVGALVIKSDCPPVTAGRDYRSASIFLSLHHTLCLGSVWGMKCVMVSCHLAKVQNVRNIKKKQPEIIRTRGYNNFANVPKTHSLG